MRLAISLLLVNWAAFAVFIFLRPSAEGVLRRRDALIAAGQFEFSSGDPWAYIAARPLYNWSEWHGGERRWVKLIEIANLPALAIASLVVSLAPGMMNVGYLQQSWVRAWTFLVAASVQWLLIGVVATWLNRRLKARAG